MIRGPRCKDVVRIESRSWRWFEMADRISGDNWKQLRPGFISDMPDGILIDELYSSIVLIYALRISIERFNVTIDQSSRYDQFSYNFFSRIWSDSPDYKWLNWTMLVHMIINTSYSWIFMNLSKNHVFIRAWHMRVIKYSGTDGDVKRNWLYKNIYL